jgi:cation:H+ antiporter
MVLGGLVPQTPAVLAVVVVAATGLVWIGSGWLEESAEALSRHYGLPEVIQGSVVVAVGSSSPELASVVFAALAGSFGMGIGAVVGSAVFNILVIPGLSGAIADHPLDANRTLVYKEALAVIYVPTPAARLTGEVTRPLAAIPLLLYGLYVFIQWQDVTEHDAGDEDSGVAVAREWGRLLAGLAVILIAVEQLVGAVDGFVGMFGIPEFLAGATILAAATSLPDALVSVRAATDGRGLTSLGNVLGRRAGAGRLRRRGADDGRVDAGDDPVVHAPPDGSHTHRPRIVRVVDRLRCVSRLDRRGDRRRRRSVGRLTTERTG